MRDKEHKTTLIFLPYFHSHIPNAKEKNMPPIQNPHSRFSILIQPSALHWHVLIGSATSTAMSPETRRVRGVCTPLVTVSSMEHKQFVQPIGILSSPGIASSAVNQSPRLFFFFFADIKHHAKTKYGAQMEWWAQLI